MTNDHSVLRYSGKKIISDAEKELTNRTSQQINNYKDAAILSVEETIIAIAAAALLNIAEALTIVGYLTLYSQFFQKHYRIFRVQLMSKLSSINTVQRSALFTNYVW